MRTFPSAPIPPPLPTAQQPLTPSSVHCCSSNYCCFHISADLSLLLPSPAPFPTSFLGDWQLHPSHCPSSVDHGLMFFTCSSRAFEILFSAFLQFILSDGMGLLGVPFVMAPTSPHQTSHCLAFTSEVLSLSL